MLSTIRVKISDQRLVITEAPKIASGGNGTNFVAFEFDESWDNFAKTGVFYTNPAAKKRSQLGLDNICEIPPQVLKKKGRMYFGVAGVDEHGKRKTSEVVPYGVDEGASPEGSLPGAGEKAYWDDVLAKIAKCETAVRDAIAQVGNVFDASMQALNVSLKHKTRHSKGGRDEIRPSDIGAAQERHRHLATEIDELLPTEYDEESETLELGELFQGDPVPEEEINAAVENYLKENPPEISGVTDDQVAKAVEDYLVENPPQGGTGVIIDPELKYSGTAADAKICGEKFGEIEQQIADILYVPIEVVSFVNDGGTKENGDKISPLTLSWELNKDPASVIVNGTNCAEKKTGSLTINGEFTETQSFEIVVSDEKGTTARKETKINFVDGIYSGCKEAPATIDSAFILSLTKKLASGKNQTVSVTGGENKFFWYAYPKSMGTSIFNIGGFDYEFESETVSFENKFGVIKDYIVYVSDNPMISNLSVTVKEG